MGWLWASGLLFWIGLYLSVATVSVQAEIVAQQSLFWVGIMNGLFGGALILVRIPIGIAAGQVSQKKLLLFGLSLVAAGNLVVLVVPHAGALLLSRFLLGSGAGFWVVFSVFYVNHYPKHEIPNAMARITLTYGLGITIGGLGGGILAKQWGWFAPFWAGLGVALLALITLAPVKDKIQVAYSFDKAKFLSQLKDKKLVTVSLLAALLFYIGTATVWGFTPNFAYQKFGATKFELGIIAFAMLGPYAFSIRFAYLLRQSMGVWKLIVFGFTGTALAILFVPLAANSVQLSLLHIVVGLGLGIIFPTLMSLSVEDLPLEQRNEAMGVFQSIYALGFILGPLIGGAISNEIGIAFVFFINGAVTLVAILTLATSGFLARVLPARNALHSEADGPARLGI